MTPTEAACRLAVAQDEMATAEALGLAREAAAFAIAVHVLTGLAEPTAPLSD